MKHTRYVVYAAVVGALYYIFVVGLAPLSFYALQFRAANILKALAVCHPAFAFGFAMGDFFANQMSPFGWLDWGIMPFFDIAGAILAYKVYKMKGWKWLAVIVQSAVIAIGVATFPLGLGARLPWLMSFSSVFVSSLIIIGIGTITLLPIWNALRLHLSRE